MIGTDVLFDTTRRVVLQSDTIDLDPTYGANDLQFGVSILIGVAVIVASALYVRYWSSRVLDDDEAEHARAVTQGLRARDRNTVRIPNADDVDVDEFRDRIRELFDDDFDRDVPTVRGAIDEAWGVARSRRRAAGRAVRNELPALSRVLSADAILYLLTGLIVTVGLSTWGAIFTASARPPAPGTIGDRAAAVATSTFDAVLELAASFPFVGVIWSLALVGVLEIGRFAYENVALVGGALLLGSVAIWIGDRAVADDVDPRIYRSRPWAVAGLVAWVVAIWISGVATATVVVSNAVGQLRLRDEAKNAVTYFMLGGIALIPYFLTQLIGSLSTYFFRHLGFSMVIVSIISPIALYRAWERFEYSRIVRPLLIAGVPFDVRVRFVVPATVEGLVAVVKD